MTILVFGDAKSCISGFGLLDRSRVHDVAHHPPGDLKRIINAADRDTFVYLDISGLSIGSVRARLKYLFECVGPRFGLLDRNGTIKDVAEVFHRGASDYVDNQLLRSQIPVARFNRVAGHLTSGDSLTSSGHTDDVVVPESSLFDLTNMRPSGTDWIDIDHGEEYTFQMLYVGLDHVKELRRKSSEDHLRNLRRTLQNILTQTFSPVRGRIWVWKEDDGVLLCPFDGERVTALTPAIRLILNRILMNTEQFAGNTPVSWRMGLHIGNTTYRASGQTGGIVSESLNFIFHLGERAISAGQFAITAPVHSLIPERAVDCFVPGPVFESSDLFFFRDLV